MQKLLDGIVAFKQQDFEEHKELFESMSDNQKPHTLFIGCSDSRVIPHLITNTLPGELFVVRNIANLVPMYRKVNEYLSTTAAIEYAVKALEVESIVVCGHSNCGGCAALYSKDEHKEDLPYTTKWLELAEKVSVEVDKQIPDKNDPAREWLTEQINIVEQMKHLLTYPFIQEKR